MSITRKITTIHYTLYIKERKTNTHPRKLNTSHIKTMLLLKKYLRITYKEEPNQYNDYMMKAIRFPHRHFHNDKHTFILADWKNGKANGTIKIYRGYAHTARHIIILNSGSNDNSIINVKNNEITKITRHGTNNIRKIKYRSRIATIQKNSIDVYEGRRFITKNTDNTSLKSIHYNLNYRNTTTIRF